jgi:hypothetical protein
MHKPKSFQAIIEHFQRNSWHFDVDCSRPIVHARFKGQNGTFRCIAAVDESDELLQVVSFVPMTVPRNKRSAAAEFCTRLSYGMKIGRFELNYEDGEFSFHTCSYYPEGELKDELIVRVVGTNTVIVDQHFPVLIRVIYGDLNPAEAANQASLVTPQSNGAKSGTAQQKLSRISFI